MGAWVLGTLVVGMVVCGLGWWADVRADRKEGGKAWIR